MHNAVTMLQSYTQSLTQLVGAHRPHTHTHTFHTSMTLTAKKTCSIYSLLLHYSTLTSMRGKENNSNERSVKCKVQLVPRTTSFFLFLFFSWWFIFLLKPLTPELLQYTQFSFSSPLNCFYSSFCRGEMKCQTVDVTPPHTPQLKQ